MNSTNLKVIKHTVIFFVIIIVYAVICYFLLNSDKHWSGIDYSDEDENKSFNRFFDFLYFSSTTYSTAGYGDVYPKSVQSRLLTLMVQFSLLIELTSLIL
jgi:hypothetical protein